MLQYIDEELLSRGHRNKLTEVDEDLRYSQQSTLPAGYDNMDNENQNCINQLGATNGTRNDSECCDDIADEESDPNKTLTFKMLPQMQVEDTEGNVSSLADADGTATLKRNDQNGGDIPNGSYIDAIPEDENAAADVPMAPPRRRDRRPNTPPRPVSNGLPPTPKVHMGACFSKVFNGCPLRINCTACWINPATRDQHILIGAEEGIYTLNLNQLHETAMDQLYPRRTVWMFVIKSVLMTLSGKVPHLYRHDLLAMHTRQVTKFSLPVNRIPERFVPRKYSLTTKVPDTKGCMRCCVGRSPYNGYKYLCGAMPNSVFLMQWYDPLNKFLLLKNFECNLPTSLKVFEMIITPDLEYPMVCVGVRKGYDKSRLKLEMVNLDSSASWFNEDEKGSTATMVPSGEILNIIAVTQLEKDTILVCYDNLVKVVNLQGKFKTNRKQAAELHFDFKVESIVCLADSVLAFHKHGMQGRSFKANEVTQEICDRSRIFNLLGSDRVIVLASQPMERTATEIGSNLYVLTGHENSY